MGALDPFQFRERHARAHLVFGEYDPTQAELDRPSRLQLIMRIIRRIDLAGDWSGWDKRNEGRFELLLSDPYDAQRIGEALRATETVRFSNCVSQRVFDYSPQTWSRLQGLLEGTYANHRERLWT